MKGYYRVMLGKGSIYATECFLGSFIGVDFDIKENLTGKLPDNLRLFNEIFIAEFQKAHPDKSKVAAGSACGTLWTIAKGIKTGDIVLCPDGNGRYRVGEIIGDYFYETQGILPHRRPVKWLSQIIDRADMSENLKNITGIGTVRDISKYYEEVEKLIGNHISNLNISIDNSPQEEDFVAFALEKHLEDFLIKNWAQTELGKKYDIYEVDGEKVGQQYQTDTGPMDILAISKDKKTLLVVELKKGRVSDVVVGQILRYMGYVQEELAEENQTVCGAIIAMEDDQRIRRALAVSKNIKFYRYQITFKLIEM